MSRKVYPYLGTNLVGVDVPDDLDLTTEGGKEELFRLSMAALLRMAQESQERPNLYGWDFHWSEEDD